MPIWQYTTAASHQPEPSMRYYLQESPIKPYTNHGSAPGSAIPSPNVAVFSNDPRFAALPPTYDPSVQYSSRSTHQIPQISQPLTPEFGETAEAEDVMDDDESEGYPWDANRSPATPSSSTSTRPSHQRKQSANKETLKKAKRAHTVVERNYRERLNDKIADLALYLFETSSDCKPSLSYFKSLFFQMQPVSIIHFLSRRFYIFLISNYPQVRLSSQPYAALPDPNCLFLHLPSFHTGAHANIPTLSTARTKPSKSLVMTRAKERLKQLEARNKSLEGEVVKLRQHIAILDHIVASKSGADEGTVIFSS